MMIVKKVVVVKYGQKLLVWHCIYPRQNSEARGWPNATPEAGRFGGIEMRLRSIQIGVFPHI